MEPNKIVEILETKLPDESWYTVEREMTLVTVPQGEWKNACEKILNVLGIKVLEDVPSKFLPEKSTSVV
jgi:hypothetical protein